MPATMALPGVKGGADLVGSTDTEFEDGAICRDREEDNLRRKWRYSTRNTCMRLAARVSEFLVITGEGIPLQLLSGQAKGGQLLLQGHNHLGRPRRVK